MNTQGEIEAAICDGMTRFEQEYMGRGPKDIHAYLIGDLILIRLQGALSAAEQHLVKSLPVEKGRDLLKEVRVQLMETARPLLEAMVEERHRRQGRELPSRHQHRDGREGGSLHARKLTAGARGQAAIAPGLGLS